MEIAKWLIAFVAVFNFGGVVADAIVPATAKQHLFNPNWPPHAKFHNAQTMLMGIFGGLISLVVLFTAKGPSLSLIVLTGVLAGNYFAAMALASTFPGTGWEDPEFASATGHPLGLNPNQIISYTLCGIVVVAIAVAGLWG